MPSLKLPQTKVKLPQNKVAKGGALFFALAIIVGIIQSITGNAPETTNSATTPSPVAPLSTSATPSSTPTPSPTTASATPTPATSSPSPTAIPLAQEKNTATVPGPDTTQSSNAQTALDTLETLEVKGRSPKTGYSREQFGQAWADIDHNGCDTRNDVLRRDLTIKAVTTGQDQIRVTVEANYPFEKDVSPTDRNLLMAASLVQDSISATRATPLPRSSNLTREEREKNPQNHLGSLQNQRTRKSAKNL